MTLSMPVTLSQARRAMADAGELLARHASTTTCDFHQYAGRFAAFCLDVFGATFWSRQLEMAQSVVEHARPCVVTANGIGKDFLTAYLALYWVYVEGGTVILTGPTERQVKHILMREIRKAFARASELPGELYALELRVDDVSRLMAFTSDNADRLTGFHADKLLICVTEAQGVDAEAFEAAFACCTAANNRLFIYGNPMRCVGPFYQAATGSTWHAITVSGAEHPNILSGRQEIPGAISRETRDAWAEEWGETSSIFGSRYYARWPTDGGVNGLVSRAWLARANARHATGEMAARERTALTRFTLALDVATETGEDACALAIVRGPVVDEIRLWRGLTTVATVDRVRDMGRALVRDAAVTPYDFYDPPTVVDTAGVGIGPYDQLVAAKWPALKYNGGSTEQVDTSRFVNLRAASYWHFRTLLEQDRVALPRDEHLAEEALATEWGLNERGLIKIIAKDDIRKTLGRSPDRLDACVEALWHSVVPADRRAHSFRPVY